MRASLEAIAGDRIVQDLIDAGSLVLVATQQEAVRRSQGRIQIPPGQRVGGAVDPETGTVYLIAEHIRPEDLAGLLRHEISVHQRRLGLDQPKPRALRLAMALLRLTPARQWMGETTFAGVLAQMERMRKAGNVRVVAAFEHALKAMKALNQDVNNPQLVAEEALSYLVGDQANADLPLFRRILAAVRAFLTRAGFKLELTTDDLVLLAQSALETAAQREVRAGAITKGVLGRNEEDAEAARQYAEVVARYTNPDGSKKAGWLKAPNGQPTKLNERQWVTPPPMTRIEVLRRAIQDRFLRFKTVQNWLKQIGINLTPDADVYGEEERSVKRFAAQAQDFRDKTLTPLVQAAGQAGYAVTGGDFIAALMDGQPLPARFKPSIPEYLIAQHAAERNRAIAKINPRYADPDQPGSGLTDAEAATILARYQALPHFAAFKTMAEQFRAIAEGTKKLLLDAGILNAETVAAWDKAYQHYVPLKGGPEDAPAKQGTGPGNSVVARQRRAMGHDLRAENVLENIFRDRERALFNIEKNKVGQALIKLVQQANNPAIGTVGQPEKHATLIQGWLHEVWIEGRPLGAYQSYNDAKAAIAADSAATGRPVAQYGVRHKAVDPSVVYMTRPLLAENEAGVYINGELVRIQLNDEAAARAYNALGVDGAGGLLKVARSFNTFLSKAYTGYNPEFLLVNMARDLTAGTINLTGKYGAGFAAQALKHYVGSFREAWRFARDKGTHTWLDRYRQAGGSTGASYLSDLERLGGDIERTFEDAQGAVATWKAGKPGAAARVLSADVVRKVFGLIEAFNQAGENALRIATFRTVIEQGGSDAEAASAAANVTVNFNRRGEMTYPLGALYLFFNPNVQGTQVLLDTLLNSPHKRQAQAAAAGMVALAFLLANLARGGDDEDEERWRRIPGYTKDRNLILQLGEKQITVPLPYGYGMFWALGNVLSDLAHGADDGKAGVRLASALFEHFSPLGNPLLGETADIRNLAEFMPTLTRIPIDLMLNRNGMGSPIMPEVMSWQPGQPDSARRWRETTGGLMDRVTTGLNKLAGGSAYESSGALTDISPETLRYLWRGLAGGAGQFLSDTLGWGLTMAQGVVPELRETPGLRKFVRVETVQNARTLFSDQANQIREAVGAFNAAKRAQDSAGMFDLVREKAALIRLGSVLEQFQGLIKTRRQLHDLIQASEMPLPQKRLQLKMIEQEESKLYGLFSQIFRHSLH